MNSGIYILLRVIPLAMATFCFAFGALIYHHGGGGGRIMAGLVVFSIGMVCVSLFCNTEIIIRRLEHAYSSIAKYVLLSMSYLIALVTVVSGIYIFIHSLTSSAFVTGHTIAGMGLVSACIAVATTASTRLHFAFINSIDSESENSMDTFSLRQERILEAVVVAISLIAWVWAFLLMINSHAHPVYFVAGHIMAGIACICTSLVAVVAAIARQARNVYTEKEQVRWLEFVLIMGSIAVIWGFYVALGDVSIANGISGYIMIGLGLVCYSIIGKIVMLGRVWKYHLKLSKLVFFIPFLTAAVCFLLSIFIFEFATISADYIITARILASLGCVCFSFVSIIGILSDKLFSIQ